MSVKKKKGADSHEAKPQLLKHTSKFTNAFVLMSKLSRDLDLECVSILQDSENKALIDTFHRVIHPDNIYSGATAGLYDSHDQYLHIHTDDNNAIEEGHNVQMCASVIFLGANKQLKRVFFAVYGRACCTQYMERVRQSNHLTNQIQVMLKKQRTRWSNSIHPSQITDGEMSMGELLKGKHIIIDKHSQVSFLLDCISKLEIVTVPFGLYRIIELCLVVGWLSSPENFYSLLVENWSVNGLPCGNLALAYLSEIHCQERSIFGCRLYQSISEGDVVRSLACLASIVNQMNRSDFGSKKSMKLTYKTAISQCEKHVLGADGITSQLIIHTLVCSGALQVPPFFASHSIIRPGSYSYSYLLSCFPDISKDRLDSILLVVADNLCVFPWLAEQMITTLGKVQADLIDGNELVIQRPQYYLTVKETFGEDSKENNYPTSRAMEERNSDYPSPVVGQCQWWLLIPQLTTNKANIQLLKKQTRLLQQWVFVHKDDQVTNRDSNNLATMTPSLTGRTHSKVGLNHLKGLSVSGKRRPYIKGLMDR